ncbi:MAG: helix-turn-helix domain-containing protein [Candidatus Aenigmarchaeota archaeon]|nr:helix-turn-helix domain-containing protein [Candidatus Aenigmarchaeota archaeon]
MENGLRAAGLTEREAKVYLALLRRGPSAVHEIAEEAGIYRTYAYEVLRSLRRKGLVSSLAKDGRRCVEAADPEKLLSAMKEREAQVRAAMPALRQLSRSLPQKPRIAVFEGKEGLRTILDDIIRTGQDIMVIGSTARQLEVLHHSFPAFIRQRVKAGLQTRVITERSRLTLAKQRQGRAELREVRFFPRDTDFPVAVNIYGRKVAMLAMGRNPVGIIIEDEGIAKAHAFMFSMLWGSAER